MSALGMFGKVAAGYLQAAEANRDKQAKETKEREKLASEWLIRILDDPASRPETTIWAQNYLREIAEGKFKGKLDIGQINPTSADPGQPPELGQMAGAPARPPTTLPMPPETSGGAPALPFELPGQAGAAGPPAFQAGAMPTPPPPTGAQYLTPPSSEEQLQQKATALENVLRNAGVPEEDIPHAVSRALTGISRPTIPKPPTPRPAGWEVIDQNGVITGVRSRDKAGPSFLRDDPAKPEEAQQFLDAAVAARATALEKEMIRDVRKSALIIERTEARIHAQGRERDRQTALKLADSARGSDLLVGKMEAILRDIEAAGGVITGPQVMALLSFHMSMTIGDLKGGRASWPIIEKHLGSRAWPETFRTFVKGIRARKGEAGLISIEQAREWVELAQKRRQLDWSVTKESILSRNLNPADFRIPADVLGDLGVLPGTVPSPPPGAGAKPKTAEEYNKLRGQQ